MSEETGNIIREQNMLIATARKFHTIDCGDEHLQGMEFCEFCSRRNKPPLILPQHLIYKNIIGDVAQMNAAVL